MNDSTFKRWNDGCGWLVFLIAASVYVSTVEPTASFWDCPEFISCAEKLQVGHPPGAPFYMLLGNFFTLFAPDASRVALMVNLLNALLSAGCILFLFWSVTRLARPLVAARSGGTLSVPDAAVVLLSGGVGALVYTFSDTFWFSAVEGEVYAFSSFLTALVFWLILRWRDEADQVTGDRWLVLIAYIIGLSLGVHLLNLLCIPAITLVFFYRKYPSLSAVKALGAVALSGLIVVGINFVYMPGMTMVGGWFELLFINVLGFPFHTGLIVFVALFLGALAVGIWRCGRRWARVAFCCLFMLTVGYGTYGVILIRSAANPPLNEDAPDNIFALRSYLNREQYESAPLLYGRSYASQPEYVEAGDHYRLKVERGVAVYSPDSLTGKYRLVRHRPEYSYTPRMLFPRMWSERLAGAYAAWSGGSPNAVPTEGENLTYFVSYQLNYMYWRYFLWNFVGRQNDLQGMGDAARGNWITGIPWIDNLRLGDQSSLPESLKGNKGHNVFYGLPLLLGLVGIWWQLRQGRAGRRQFNVVLLLFFMTGLAIVLYLNQPPMQPRERDYAYAGSFYAFAIWVGMGVAGVSRGVARLSSRRGEKKERGPYGLLPFLCLLIPLQMASQTWDDHDRSHRYTCRDFGRNYLMTLPDEGNPIIFCNGDNDTFPLWYNQDTEGERRDVRVCNLSYAQTDWYIRQQQCPLYDAPALPISWTPDQYEEGTNDYVPIRPELKEQVEAFYRQHPEEAARHFGDDPFDSRNILSHWVFGRDKELRVIPTDTIYLRVDKQALLRSGIMLPTPLRKLEGQALLDALPDKMSISLRGLGALTKADLLVLEVLANCDWERPLYIATTVGDEASSLDFGRYFLLEGLAYRFTPFDYEASGDVDPEIGHAVDTERLYLNLMSRYRYGGMEREGLYLDETTRRTAAYHTRLFSVLVHQLVKQGDEERAREVVEYAAKVMK
ncbi:MAG: DUF2723 domain-containing protein [Mediterranea sp.]|jgi:hypothetical protein|nr:DUF2723 domain-containing protein [Mediterranea sp.]